VANGLPYIPAYTMENQARPPARRRDDDGVEITAIARGRRIFWLIGLAIALPIVATITAIAVIRSTPSSRAGGVPRTPDDAEMARAEGAAPPVAPSPAALATSGAAPIAVPRRIATSAPVAPGASPAPKPEKPRREIDAKDAIEMLREAGEHEGIAAFGLPGTEPPKAGIIVPGSSSCRRVTFATTKAPTTASHCRRS
jgi:hypothetical protein